MDNLTPQIEEKLGFDLIKSHLAGRASTEDAKQFCLEVMPFRNGRELDFELRRVAECKTLMDEEEAYYLEYTGSVRHILEEASVVGNWLSKDEVFNLYKWLKMVRDLHAFFRGKKEKYPELTRLASTLSIDRTLTDRIAEILDDRGNIKDTASDDLRKIRRNIHRLSNDVRKVLAKILRQAVDNGWSPDAEVTLRNDRLVIPLKADFKGRIKGFVHDVSQSGQTIFLEPADALELNNQLRSLFAEEQKELVRIFVEFTDQVREVSPQLREIGAVVTHLDFIRAKARMGVEMGANLPVFKKNSDASQLVSAYHPILLIKSGHKKDNIVPLSIHLNSKRRIVLISGPNAGGKSVALKTVGLLQLMWQSGMLVPAEEYSEFRMYNKIFVDIGDEQSLQSDLSTYTSHLKVMSEMLAGLDNHSLFLLDEFGTGTDPRMGGAMAESFLERFVKSGGFGIITTHYGNLKAFADNSPGISNASMQFDPDNLAPTYQIEVGIPGRSYAFEIAQKAGIPQEVIEDAKGKMEGGEVYAEELLLKLEEQRVQLDQLLEDNKKKKEELGRLLRKNLELNKNIEVEKSRIIRNAHEQAQNLINSANSKIEHTIREIKETQAQKDKTRKLRKELTEMLPEPPPDLEELVQPEPEPDVVIGAVPEVGDDVKMKDSDAVGKVLEIQGKRAVVAIGGLRVTAKMKNLLKVKSAQKEISRRAKGAGGSQIRRKANISMELNIMGLRVEAAIPVVSKFMDDAILGGLPSVRILHGKGTGALREAIRGHLRSYPEVRRITDESPQGGGDGWTVVELGK